MADCVTVSACDEELDPLLVHAVRLFVVTLLVDMRWRDFATIRDELGVAAASLPSQLTKLRDAGYVESRWEAPQTLVRLTPLGCERLTDHLAALQAIVTKAGQIIASAVSAASDGERSPR
jgi:predicted transcriptional regulator